MVDGVTSSSASPPSSPHHEIIAALRPVELVPIEEQGEALVVLNDRYGIAPEPLVVRAAIVPFLQLFDGRHTVLDLQAALSRASGRIIASDVVRELVGQLDAALLLESDTFRRAKEQVVTRFRREPRRAPTHAGQAYPADGAGLRRLLDARKAEHAAAVAPLPRDRLRALIAPHIDYERGASAYARAYRCLEQPAGAAGPAAGPEEEAAEPPGGAPEVYVLLGTAHTGVENLFSVLPKSFATPLATLPVDEELAAELVRRHGAPTDLDLLAHRQEHSLELTATYLAYALDGRPAPILPVLCGVSYLELAHGGEAARQAIRRFTGDLHETLARLGRRACIVVGADLAHVGPRFGDSAPVSESFLAEVEAADRRSLAAVVAGDAEGFAARIVEVEDRYRVCGLGAIYAALCLLAADEPPPRGRLLDYGQAAAADRSQCVTYAGLVFESGGGAASG